METNINRIIDECIDRINHGESLESCLANYPDYAEQLKPLLQTMVITKGAYSFAPSAGAKRAARDRFNVALAELERRREERQTAVPWFLGWSKVWATAAAVLLIVVVSYFGLRPMLFPSGDMPQPSPDITTPGPEPGPVPVTPEPQPSPAPVITTAEPGLEGNFVFLISDDVNAISDFKSVDVHISKIGLLQGDSGKWVEFTPELEKVDLTLVQGELTQEIWRGNIPTGQYKKVYIEVSTVSGILEETNKDVEIKLPSQKLHVSKQFQITSDMVTSFTYDLTVVAAGSPTSGIKYILKPQVDESGANYNAIEDKGRTATKDESENQKVPTKPD